MNLLKKCTSCRKYSLSEKCPFCGAMTKTPHPSKIRKENL